MNFCSINFMKIALYWCESTDLADRFTFTEIADINQCNGVTAINTSDKSRLGRHSRKAAFCFTEPSVAICRVATNQNDELKFVAN